MNKEARLSRPDGRVRGGGSETLVYSDGTRRAFLYADESGEYLLI